MGDGPMICSGSPHWEQGRSHEKAHPSQGGAAKPTGPTGPAGLPKMRGSILSDRVLSEADQARLPTGSALASNILTASAIHSISIGVVIQDTLGACVYANPSAAELLGVSTAKMLGRESDDPRWRAVAENGDDLPGGQHPSMICLRTGVAVRGFVMGVRRPGGERRWLRVDAVPLLNAAGLLEAVESSFTDITEERRLRKDLALAEGRLNRARRAGRVGLWEWHLPSDTVWSDDGYTELTSQPFGATTEAWLRTIHVEDRDRVAAHARDGAALGGPCQLSYRALALDGSERTLVTLADVIETDSAGRPVTIGGSVVDVTALEHANTQVRQLLDRMTDGYLTLDREWRVGYLNEQAAAVLCRRREDLIRAHLWTEFPDAVGTTFEDHYCLAMEGEEVAFESYYDGLERWFEVRAHPLPDGIAVYFRDVTDRHREADEREELLRESERARADLSFAAFHDSLTALPNRAALEDWLEHRIRGGTEDGLTLFVVDLDRFNRVNDSHGHFIGDGLLVLAARRLQEIVPPSGMTARLSGDDFIIGVPAIGEADARSLANRMLDTLRLPFTVGERRLFVTASIGMARASRGASAENLMRDADHALHQAKKAGKDCMATFDEGVRQQVEDRLAIGSDLRDALQRRELGPHYQPIFDTVTGAAVGAEALARWSTAGRGFVSPAMFIPVAEETGLVMALGEVMTDAVTQSYEEINRSLEGTGAVVWVNVSIRQLDEPSFAALYVERVRQAGLIGRVGIEITETALACDNKIVETAVRELAAAGFPVAIDDFGTGYSSLARLSSFPVHMLKIDRSFVEGLCSETGVAVVAAIVGLGHAIGAVVCAEGIETAEQLTKLCELGVDKVSGYYLCRPAPLAQLAAGTTKGRELLALHGISSHVQMT